MILKQERVEKEICKSAPNIGVPFQEEKKPHRFYQYNPALSQVIAGYQRGIRNPYVEKLMSL